MSKMMSFGMEFFLRSPAKNFHGIFSVSMELAIGIWWELWWECDRMRNTLWTTHFGLVGGLVAINFIFPEILGMSSSQLTNSYFSEGWPANHPNWLSYFSEGWLNHQPVMDDSYFCFSWDDGPMVGIRQQIWSGRMGCLGIKFVTPGTLRMVTWVT